MLKELLKHPSSILYILMKRREYPKEIGTDPEKACKCT
jgi:hypothetical protein